MKIPFLILLCFVSTVVARPPVESFKDAFGEKFDEHPRQRASTFPTSSGPDSIHRWNQIAIDATGVDHTPPAPGENRVFGEQVGPGRSSRAMAIVHIAMFDAINATVGRYQSFTGVTVKPRGVSLAAAVSQAAHDTLVSLYPSQTATFDSALAQDLSQVRSKRQRARGISLGREVAATLLTSRLGDGSELPEVKIGAGGYQTSDLPGRWREDPISQILTALGSHWGACKTFVVESGSQFRAPAPPALESAEYAAAYNEAKAIGGDGIVTPTQRTDEQTFIGTFWAYDGTPSLCAPPRLYNQITVHIGDQMGLGPLELARLLALVNVALADTGMTTWESKYYYDFWRPVIGIRESDPGTGPTLAGDGNSATAGDLTFTPLGAPASNLNAPNFTPPFPSYPSGHGAFGGALFETLRRFFGTDDIAFTFVSDEFNGVTQDHDGNVRPYMPRSFVNLSEAEEENGQSRIYLGIHWRFDKTSAIEQGRKVADYVFDHAFLPVQGQ
jgi:PAP2 superfamily.